MISDETGMCLMWPKYDEVGNVYQQSEDPGDSIFKVKL
jgi:hypothetical protein